MAQERDRDELDRDLPLNEEAPNDEETRGMGDEFEGDAADADDDEEFTEDEPTEEVGSEGGSPGDVEKVRKPR